MQKLTNFWDSMSFVIKDTIIRQWKCQKVFMDAFQSNLKENKIIGLIVLLTWQTEYPKTVKMQGRVSIFDLIKLIFIE